MRFIHSFSIPFLLLTFSTITLSQQAPRLVIGITIDQMRYEYLYRYQDKLSETGFKRLMKEGHVIHDGHFRYAPTYTGPGHASIYTGTGPALNGIVGNEWYSRKEKRIIYCAEDAKANPVGSNSIDGKMSPRNLTSTTLADQLEIATNGRSKTIGIAIKDRGSILPAGFLADGAYWYDKNNGLFITSDFYRDSLPDWVNAFNARKLPDTYISQPWETLLPIEQYDESYPDDQPKERPFANMEKAVFPYDLEKISGIKVFGMGETRYGIIPATPHGNSLTLEFAKAAIEGEQLGKDPVTDLLAISFSSTDYAGHQFGPHSVEVQDMYLRLDRQLGEFLQYLDATIGLKNVLVFLTADHGAADIPTYISPTLGYFQEEAFETVLRKRLSDNLGTDPVEFFINQQIYFNRSTEVDEDLLEKELRNYAAEFPGVYGVISLKEFDECVTDPAICERIKRGIMPDRSGDYYVQLYPGWLPDYSKKGGTTHGSPYAYDTHVPIIFFGWNVKPKDNYRKVWIEDIAPTVSEMLRISRPSGCTGSPIMELFR